MGVNGVSFSIALLFLLCSCLPAEDGREGLDNVEDFSVGEGRQEQEGACVHYYQTPEHVCRVSGCPEGTHIATQEEREDVLGALEDALKDGDIDGESAEEIRAGIEAAKALCLDGPGVLRPDGEVFIGPDFCVCRNNLPALLGNCAGYCANVGVTTDTRDRYILYGSVDLGSAVAENEYLGSLYGWCNEEIPGGLSAPECRFVVEDDEGGIYTPPMGLVGGNRFSVDLTDLPKGKTYIGSIREVQSGSGASSDKIQLRLLEPVENGLFRGPLQIVPISQYSCFKRDGQKGPAGRVRVYDHIARVHYFYFDSSTTPTEIDGTKNSGGGYLFCHDIERYGLVDSPRFERLEYIPRHFALWSGGDVRFLDLDDDGQIDINKKIVEEIADRYKVRRTGLKVFSALPARTSPAVDRAAPIGHMTIPWVDPKTNRGYCPNQSHYNDDEGDPVFRVLKEYVGVDMEALYLAVKEVEFIFNSQGEPEALPEVYMYIREGELKDIWFNIEAGRLVRPDEDNLDSKTTFYFYWPADPRAPYTKKDYQRRFKIVGSDELEGADAGSSASALRPSDKRIGCIPALD